MEKVFLFTSDVFQVAPLSRNSMVQRNFRIACLSFSKIETLHLKKKVSLPLSMPTAYMRSRGIAQFILKFSIKRK